MLKILSGYAKLNIYCHCVREACPKDLERSLLAFPKGSNPKGLSVSECMINFALLLSHAWLERNPVSGAIPLPQNRALKFIPSSCVKL
jgi:hypothetical protein